MTSQKLEERVFQKRKEIQKAEAEIEQLKETMRAEEWLEQDLRQLERAEQEVLEILRQSWQGSKANGFHHYIEDVQLEESRAWKKGFAHRQTNLEQARSEQTKSLFHLENQQQDLQREWTAYESH